LKIKFPLTAFSVVASCRATLKFELASMPVENPAPLTAFPVVVSDFAMSKFEKASAPVQNLGFTASFSRSSIIACSKSTFHAEPYP